jgi:catechol 2,3-dioxygenase-like lactoylglutathione lyase family enzyme
MIEGVDFITLPTQDFDRAIEFYGTTLGLEESIRYGEMPGIEFETGSLTLSVIESTAFGIEFAPHTHPVALHVADVAAAAASSNRAASSSPPRRSTAASATWPTSATPTATSSCCTAATCRGTTSSRRQSARRIPLG